MVYIKMICITKVHTRLSFIIFSNLFYLSSCCVNISTIGVLVVSTYTIRRNFALACWYSFLANLITLTKDPSFECSLPNLLFVFFSFILYNTSCGSLLGNFSCLFFI